MKNEELQEILKNRVSRERYLHTLGVKDTAIKLAELWEADKTKAETAALLHDIARDYDIKEIANACKKYGIEKDETEMAVPELLHGAIGENIAQYEFGINDREILDAIRYHTTGRKNMSILDKIIFIADMIEPGRNFPGVDNLRVTAFKDMNKAVLEGLNSTIRFVLNNGLVIHPRTIEARNNLINPDKQEELGKNRRI